MLTIRAIEPINACKKCPVAQTSPINTAQKINAISCVSLIVVLNKLMIKSQLSLIQH